MEKERGRTQIRRYEKDTGGLIMASKTIELKIYNVEDRLEVAKILVKNGYTVSQGKRKKTEKSVEYVLRATEDLDNADTNK